MTTNLLPLESISNRIILLRGQKVLLDVDLAALYGVETKRFNEQVRRNMERFPQDFMFQLDQDEWTALRSQFATLKPGRGQHRKYVPFVFTEHGAIMAAAVLNSPQAIEVSVYVVRAFVMLRETVSTNRELAHQFEELARKVDIHDQAISELIDALREMMRRPESIKRSIGFVTNDG